MPDTEEEEPHFFVMCEHPERPPDKRTAFHTECLACVRAIQVLQASNLWSWDKVTVEMALAWSGPDGRQKFMEWERARRA